MPTTLESLHGRNIELGEVVQMLVEQRFVTISGGGGMGKTRLAEAVGQQLAQHMPVWMIELASVNAPELLLSAVARGLAATVIDVHHVREALVLALGSAKTLLILDNCEHLAEAVGQLCADLLAELPQLHVLVTSQELLRRPEEAVYKLGPLSLPQRLDLSDVTASGALMLLQARVRAQWRLFEFSPDNLGDAVAICRQLDGMPLAIELAAGRVPLLGLAGVRARLGEMFRLLTGDARVRLRRHQTLRAALDWSYQLLDEPERRLLRRLGTFNGSFGLSGVREIGTDPGEDDWLVLDTLGSLIDKSLVQVRDQSSPRYLLLETTRAYA
ncbi:ATP-binding protein, partial [Roseateles sp. GG27B]